MKEHATLYELMGQDTYLKAVKDRRGWICMTITDHKDDLLNYMETHEFAWDSLVSFAKQVLREDKRLSTNAVDNTVSKL